MILVPGHAGVAWQGGTLMTEIYRRPGLRHGKTHPAAVRAAAAPMATATETAPTDPGASTPSAERVATGPHDHNSARITKLEPEPYNLATGTKGARLVPHLRQRALALRVFEGLADRRMPGQVAEPVPVDQRVMVMPLPTTVIPEAVTV